MKRTDKRILSDKASKYNFVVLSFADGTRNARAVRLDHNLVKIHFTDPDTGREADWVRLDTDNMTADEILCLILGAVQGYRHGCKAGGESAR